MLDNDQRFLESFERIYKTLKTETENLKDLKSVHSKKIKKLEDEIKAYARIFEDISLPARFILEHLLELMYKSGQIAVEGDYISQSFSNINDIKVEQFGLIKVYTGNLQLSWRDNDYNYLIYPDMVELRTIDEKATVRIFFSLNFGKQIVNDFSKILDSPKVHYFHPTLKSFINNK